MSSVPSAPEGSADTASSDSGQPRQFLDEATMDSINKVAVDNAAEEYAASAAEYAQNGWHYEGTSTVVGSPKVAEGTYQGKRARFVEVCLDSSQVKTKDSAGRELQSGGKRSLNIYTLVESDGTWKIAQHDFPNIPIAKHMVRRTYRHRKAVLSFGVCPCLFHSFNTYSAFNGGAIKP